MNVYDFNNHRDDRISSMRASAEKARIDEAFTAHRSPSPVARAARKFATALTRVHFPHTFTSPARR